MPEDSFTPRELDVMSILWDLGSATVAEVRDRMADELAYTSVLSALQVLQEKGYVRPEQEGRAYRYFPLVDREAAGDREIGRLLDKVFRGSPEMLMMQLVNKRGVNEAQLRKIRSLLDERLSDTEHDT